MGWGGRDLSGLCHIQAGFNDFFIVGRKLISIKAVLLTPAMVPLLLPFIPFCPGLVRGGDEIGERPDAGNVP